MTPIIALAGFGGFSSEDEFWFDAVFLVGGILRALFLPIITFRNPPHWMVLLQPVLVVGGVVAVHLWQRSLKLRLLKRMSLYALTYCSLMFVTNMAGEARGVFSVAGDMIQHARLISEGKGYSSDTRP